MDQSSQRRSTQLKEKLDEKQKEAQAKAKLLEKQLSDDFNAVAETPEGRRVFRYLKDFCNFDRSKLAASFDSRTIDMVTTTVNAAKETVYLAIRSRIDKRNLTKIEQNKGE